ncbi:uncharacterized protein LOC5509252 [Nematostella vectensis]|uniref:uncharacterized protein LOC5509252 n=1 Tax=Nematostella vectensis TaxID=45351 RepID=UPI0020777720|nr:uncharacterized protein LOC5509252 [Nematostella vectensis]
MESLPEEMIAHILSFFHQIYGKLLLLRTVCRKWKIIIDSSSVLWKHIHLDDTPDYFSGKRYLRFHGNLRVCLTRYKKYIHCIRADDQKFFENIEIRNLLVNLTNLRKLDIPILRWTRYFANTLLSRNLLKHVTIDDYQREGFYNIPEFSVRALQAGVRSWDMKSISRVLPSLEVLSLSCRRDKLIRLNIVSILGNLHLNELHLNVRPDMRRAGRVPIVGVPPLRELLHTQHANILTTLEIRCLPVSMNDAVLFTKGFKSLQHLTLGCISTTNEDNTTLELRSESLKILHLSFMRNCTIEILKCEMHCLEGIAITECYNITSLEIDARILLTLTLRNNCSLKNIETKCSRLSDMEVRNCACLKWKDFQKMLRENQGIKRMELADTESESIEVNERDAPNLRKLAISEADVVLKRVYIDCPRLEVLKMIGSSSPRKRPRGRHKGCSAFISSGSLRKVKILDVIYIERINIRCVSLKDLLVVRAGLLFSGNSLAIDLRAAESVGNIMLSDLALKQIHVYSPRIANLMLQSCCLATEKKGKCKVKIKCEVIEELRIIRSGIKRFTLNVPFVRSLTLDSCHRLAALDVDLTKVKNIRVERCPNLATHYQGLRNKNNGKNNEKNTGGNDDDSHDDEVDDDDDVDEVID